jgi:hypothetical protein
MISLSKITFSKKNLDKILEKSICELFNINNNISSSFDNERLKKEILPKLLNMELNICEYSNNTIYNFITRNDKKILILSDLKLNVFYETCNSEEIKNYILENHKFILSEIFAKINNIDLFVIIKFNKNNLEFYSFESLRFQKVFESYTDFIWKKSLKNWDRKNTLLSNNHIICEWIVPEFNKKFSIYFSSFIQIFNEKEIYVKKMEEIDVKKMEEINVKKNEEKNVVEILESLSYEEDKHILIDYDENLMKLLIGDHEPSRTYYESIKEFFIKYFILITLFIIYSEFYKLYYLNK